jgi:murein DD-endopeptidase MepM/ murein hydrolase activator NlpD
VLQSVSALAVVALLSGGSAAARIHAVRPGDTLDGLARRYGVPTAELARTNGLADPDLIRVGDRLVIAGPPSTRPNPPVTTIRPTLIAARSPRPVAVPASRARLAGHFARYAREARVPADLAMALAWQESGWQTGIVSPTRAVGVMQLMPDTVAFTSKVLLRQSRNLDPVDPAANIRLGTRFLRYLLDRSAGNTELALASYYQGLRSVRERGVHPETARFVANVLALRPRF